MKKYLIIVGGLVSTATFAAMPVYQPIGSTFTLGSSANQRSLSTSLANPAASYLMVNKEDKDSFRFGIIGPLSVGYEVGDISDLDDKIDELEDLLEADYTSQSQVESAISSANSIIDEVADVAYIKFSGSMQVPFMPVIYKTESNGAFTLDSSVSMVGRGEVLADDLSYTISGTDYSVDSDTSLFVKAAIDYAFGFGYSQALWKTKDSGMLIGGVKANIHSIALSRALAVLTDDSEDADDAFSDSLTEGQNTTTGVSLDLGAIWVADYYQVGLTLANINEPEFDFSDLGSNCSSLSGSSAISCSAAVNLASDGELSLSETYTMEMQTTIDAAVTSKNKRWTLSGSYDANSVKDPVGDDYQWSAVSVSYYGDSHFLPGVRVGYRKNMAGTELSYLTAGLTLLKRLNLDVAYGLETTEDDDGDEMPRSAYVSLGYSTAF